MNDRCPGAGRVYFVIDRCSFCDYVVSLVHNFILNIDNVI